MFDVGIEVLWVVDEEILEDLSHQSVLAHEDLSNTTHLFAGLIHLLRADVVDLHNEHLIIGVQQSLSRCVVVISFNETFVVICSRLMINLIWEIVVEIYLHLLCITDLLFLGERHVVWRWFW